MNETRVTEARELLEELLPEMKLDGLSLNDVSFDFFTESIDASFEWNGNETRLRLPMERIDELKGGKTFAVKRLREQLQKNLGAEED